MKSLRKEILNTLKVDHPELVVSPRERISRAILEYIRNKERWWIIVLLLLITFLLGAIINLDAINFIVISEQTAKIIVDQRTANIAAIISITLVVVGFLLNNLAIKDPFAYQLLFKHSFLYPIIYFTLGTIACFVVISTCRDWLTPDVFKKMVIVGTYLMLIILVLIGLLFRTIISFANAKEIEKLFNDELIVESKGMLMNILVKNKSKEKIQKLMEQQGVELYDWKSSLGFGSKNIKFIESDRKGELSDSYEIIYDIDLDRVKAFVKKIRKKGEVVYFEVGLNELKSNYESFIWNKDIEPTASDNAILKKAFKTKKVSIYEDNGIFRKYFDQKLEDFVSENKHKSVENLLSSMLELYKMQMKSGLK